MDFNKAGKSNFFHIQKQYYWKMVQILWLKDSDFMNFTFKMIKRILITNSKIIRFKKIIDNIIKKVREEKGFVQTVLKNYDKSRKQ